MTTTTGTETKAASIPTQATSGDTDRVVTIWSTPNCSKCKATKRRFEQKEALLAAAGVKVVVDDITDPAHEELLASFKEAGHLVAPIVVTPSKTWSDFRPNEVADFLKTLEAELEAQA